MNVNFWLYSILLLLLPFGQLGRINLWRPEINFYVHEIVMAVLIILNRKIIWKELKKLKYFWGFVGVGILATLMNMNPRAFSLFPLNTRGTNMSWLEIGISLLYLVRFVGYILVFLVIKNYSYRFPISIASCRLENDTEGRNLNFQKIWMGSIGLTLGLGFLQYFLVQNHEFLFIKNWDRHNFRLTGTYLDPGFTGIILTMMFFVVIKLIGIEKIAIKEKQVYSMQYTVCSILKNKKLIFQLGILLLILIQILLTYSRASYLAFLVALGYYGFVKNKFKWGFVFGFIFILSLLVLPKKFGEGTKLLRISTINARLKNYDEAIYLIKQRPILGWGFNTLRYVKRDLGKSDEKWQVSHSQSGIDNSVFYILATTGITGLIFYFLMIKELLKDKMNLINKCILIVIFVSGMFSNAWFYPFVMGYYLLWMGKTRLNLDKKP